MANFLITGGSGRLGSAVRHVCQKVLISCYAPPSGVLDVLDYESCAREVSQFNPDIIIHCAGYSNALEAETDRGDCWMLNVEGTRNMVRAAAGRRFVYISTDYVFDGEEGNYSESDVPNPINFYGMSKLAGEVATAEHENTLILRAPFRSDPPWRFDHAFTDQWTSCDYVSMRAPDVLQASLSKLTGLLHIGGARRSIYELARGATPGVGKMKRSDITGLRIPRDTSLNSSRWKAWSDARA